MVTDYVLGFARDDLYRIALIEKLKPEWQKGLHNGIGGKVEAGEYISQAMSREFFEETGVHIPAEGWTWRGIMYGPNWTVQIFTAFSHEVRGIRSTTPEKVGLFTPWNLPKCVSNVPGLLKLLFEAQDSPTITISYDK